MGPCALRRSSSPARSIVLGALSGALLFTSGDAFAQSPAAAATVFEATTPVAAMVTQEGWGAPSGTLRFGVRNVSENERLLRSPVLCGFGLGDAQLYSGSPKVEPVDEASTFGSPFSPMSMRDVQVAIRDIPSPGKYKGKLCFSNSRTPGQNGPDGKPLPDKPELPAWKLDVEFSLLVKSDWRWALFAISCGVAASEVLRAWLSRGRKRLVQRINVQKLAERLGRLTIKTREDVALAAIADVAREIAEIQADLESPSPSTTDADLESLAAKLPLVELWVDVRGAVLNLNLVSDQKRQDLLKSLGDPEALIRTPHAPKASLETSLNTLRTLSVEQAQREAQQKAISDLDSMVDDAVTRGIKGDLAPVQESLEAAKKAFREDGRGAIDTHIDTARKGLARLLTDELRADLEKKESPHFKPEEWAALKGEVKALLDAPVSGGLDGIEQYQKAYQRYASARANVLVRAMEERMKVSMPETEMAKLTSARDALMPVRAKKAMGDAPLAIKTALDLLDKPLPGAGPVERDTAGGDDTGFDAPMGYLPDKPSPNKVLSPSAEKLTNRLRAYDFAAAFTLFVVAALSGLRILWASSDTWGSPSDWLTAILWGFGVQATGNTPFEGIAALRERLSKLTGS